MAKFNQPDPRNEGTWCWVNGLVRREDAKVSVLDSVVQGGDAVWEGLRVSEGRIYQMDEHLQRMVDSAHALQFADIPPGMTFGRPSSMCLRKTTCATACTFA